MSGVTGRFLGALALLAAAGALVVPARADRDIVFAAEFHRDSTPALRGSVGGAPEKTLESLGASHVYRINPDGSGRMQVTTGDDDDSEPRWSPDGKRIAFLRQRERSTAICLVGADGGAVTVLAKPPDGCEVFRLRWSPDGRMLAVELSAYYSAKPAKERGAAEWLYLIDVATRRLRRVRGAADFAWSPDGRRLLVRYMAGYRMLDARTGALRALRGGVSSPTWFAAQEIRGDAGASHDRLATIGPDGRTKGSLRLRFRGGGDRDQWMQWDPFSARSREWVPLGDGKRRWLVQVSFASNAGRDYWCSTVDMGSGAWRPLRRGMLIGAARDGSRAALTNQDWYGDRRHGAERVGPLEIVDLKTGRAKAITGKFVSINGGDWR